MSYTQSFHRFKTGNILQHRGCVRLKCSKPSAWFVTVWKDWRGEYDNMKSGNAPTLTREQQQDSAHGRVLSLNISVYSVVHKKKLIKCQSEIY